MDDEERRRQEGLERALADFRGRLDAFLEDLERAQGADDDRLARAADRARALADELALLGEPEPPAGRIRDLVLSALREAHQPLRESVLYERVIERGAAVSPEDFVALASDLATMGQVRVAVEHDLPCRDEAPFQPRFYRPAPESPGPGSPRERRASS
jgi:hypothetical protein